MRTRRTIYHNDARHSYLWYFEPPMRLEDAWIPIDEVAGTAVDTFSYCVERGDGMFYPTKVGKMFSVEDGKAQSNHNYEWRAAACMLSLMERGLDPLQVLIDRAHEHGMDFIADLRLQRLGKMYPELELENGGKGWAEDRVRDLKFDILHELVTEYPIQGVELDFTAAFGEGEFFYFTDGGTPENTATMTEWVRRVSEMARSQPGERRVVGARIFPTEKGNLDQGLDVRTWLSVRGCWTSWSRWRTSTRSSTRICRSIGWWSRRTIPAHPCTGSCSTTSRTRSSGRMDGSSLPSNTSGRRRPTTGRRTWTACIRG